MFAATANTSFQKTTSYKVVLPFYLYAAVSFLIACWLLFTNTEAMHNHYFNPSTLAITHLMALGWGTMIILGASHQLVPVLIEGKLYSDPLAYLAFALAGIGIPLLVCGFYEYNTGWPMKTGAVLINAAVIFYLVNLGFSIYQSKRRDVHSIFVFTAALWLLTTTLLGLLLVFNFTSSLLPRDSVNYLSLHAHMGLAGWFLLLVIGVGARLIPMFLISKFTNKKWLWWIFSLINVGLIGFILLWTFQASGNFFYSPFFLVAIALVLFVAYCYTAFKQRIRKQVDAQMKVSLLSVALLLLPLICLLVVIYFLTFTVKPNLILLYGFCIFFGWITAIILGMTFKTLPFIVWNKVYHKRAGAGKTPVPKELFSERLFQWMAISYLSGFIIFIPGLIFLNDLLLKTGAIALMFSSVFYVWNVAVIVFHQPAK